MATTLTSPVTRRTEYFDRATQALKQCREGEVIRSGNELWVLGHAFVESGFGTYEDLGTTLQEVKTFLIQAMRLWLERARKCTESYGIIYYDIQMLQVYLDEGIPYKEVGTTEAELDLLLHNLTLRGYKMELSQCRSNSPTPLFRQVTRDLREGRFTLEELGATPEELERLKKELKEIISQAS